MSDSNKIEIAKLRKKIDALIAIDNQYRSEQEKKYPNGIMIGFGSPAPNTLLEDILNEGKSPVIIALEELSTDELIYIMALMWFGRGDGIAGSGATFESVLDYAKREFDNRSISYIGEKPLGTYLSRGLERL